MKRILIILGLSVSCHAGARTITGIASFYSRRFEGRRTATGERYRSGAMTLACRRLPLGTRVLVTNLRTGRSAVARVNDRGPFVAGRIADLSQGLARRIGLSAGVGLTRVRIVAVHG